MAHIGKKLLFTLILAAILPLSGARAEVEQKWAGLDLPPEKRRSLPVLAPEKFFGKVRAGYQAAKECPEVCAQLFCYCGCDMTDDHNSLLDCFSSDHGVDCHICIEEALMALKLKKQGKSIAEIRKAVDAAFTAEYPFDQPSAYLTTYRKQKGLSLSGPAATKPSGTAGKKATSTKKGSCCGHK